MTTPIDLIYSHEPQAGKTTYMLKKMLETHGKQDTILFTFDRKGVLKDAVDKLKTLAEKDGINISNLITNKKDLKTVHNDRLKGNIYPVTVILMGNISNMTSCKQILSMEHTIRFPQCVIFDEIHRYLVGEGLTDKSAQIDAFIKELIENDQCTKVYAISATPHDLMWSDLTFSSVTRIPEYEGFKGLRDAKWEIIDEIVFKTIKDNYAHYKKTGEALPLPVELTEFIHDYNDKDIIINMNREISFHEWFQSYHPDITAYNSEKKDLSTNIVGKGSCGISQTFSHSKIMYWADVKAPSTSLSNIIQELGRVNGRHRPVICTTQAVKDVVMNYFENIEKAEQDNAYELCPKERKEYWESLNWINPQIVPSNKHKQNRNIISSKSYAKGAEQNCQEVYRDFYIPELYEQSWQGKGWGDKARDIIKVLDPSFYEEIKNLSIITNTDTRQDGDLWYKHKYRHQLRVAKNPQKKGYVAFAIRPEGVEGDFYSIEGGILSDTINTSGVVLKK